MEFSESRVYTPGDDIRSIDWRVTARSGVAHTKLFDEEREHASLLIIDYSPSMYFASRRALKAVVAAELAALIAWRTVGLGDRVGALLFSDVGHLELRPAGGSKGVLRLIHELVGQFREAREQIEMSVSTSLLHTVLRRVRRVCRPGSTIYVLSDFYRLDDQGQRHLSRLSRHNDVVLLWISDPLERQPLPAGDYLISDGRARHRVGLRNEPARRKFIEPYLRRKEVLQQLARKHAMRLIPIDTGSESAAQLQAL